MRTVHKYVLGDVTTKVSTFEGVKFLTAANQREQITVWAEVNTMERECLRTLHVVGTGHDVPAGCDYIGSALMAGGDFVFHIYAERPSTSPATSTPEEG